MYYVGSSSNLLSGGGDNAGSTDDLLANLHLSTWGSGQWYCGHITEALDIMMRFGTLESPPVSHSIRNSNWLFQLINCRHILEPIKSIGTARLHPGGDNLGDAKACKGWHQRTTCKHYTGSSGKPLIGRIPGRIIAPFSGKRAGKASRQL